MVLPWDDGQYISSSHMSLRSLAFPLGDWKNVEVGVCRDIAIKAVGAERDAAVRL